jgi:heme O synthase-like polyprenyltransferase
MIIAARGWPGTGLFLVVALGGYMMAGAANAINMVVDRDIDARMKRTAKRPTVTQKIGSREALLFAFVLALWPSSSSGGGPTSWPPPWPLWASSGTSWSTPST